MEINIIVIIQHTMFSNLFHTKEKNNKIGYEDVLHAISKTDNYVIINTIASELQTCLIKTTLSVDSETDIINKLVENYQYNSITIIIYGINSADETMDKKYKQLVDLGFSKVFIYTGGIFEWLLLQDVYGQDNFPTTSNTLDILKYKPKGRLHIQLIKM